MRTAIILAALIATTLGTMACADTPSYTPDDSDRRATEQESTAEREVHTSRAAEATAPHGAATWDNTASGTSTKANFVRCLNDVAETTSLLPWQLEIQDPETGNTWDLRDYHESGMTRITTFHYLHCRQHAPVPAKTDNVNRCVIDNVKYVREHYPGSAVQSSALIFALTVCIPPWRRR